MPGRRAWISTHPPSPPHARWPAPAAEDEYRRLLYVATTRAEERLYLAGFHGANGPQAGCWHEMIEASLGADFDAHPAFWDDTVEIRRRVSTVRTMHADAAPEPAAPTPMSRPAWALRGAACDGARHRSSAVLRSAIRRGRR